MSQHAGFAASGFLSAATGEAVMEEFDEAWTSRVVPGVFFPVAEDLLQLAVQ